MCRGLQQQQQQKISQRDRLNIKAFYIRLSHHHHTSSSSLPDYLTLHYLPRINGSPLQIDGSDIRSDTPAFLTLYRVLSGDALTYGSRERVRASSGARFQVYLNHDDDKVIKGIFRKGQFSEWKMECKFTDSSSNMESGLGLKEAEILVETEEEEEEEMMKLREKVDMAAMVVRHRRRGKGRSNRGGNCLEEIPEEERETEPENEEEVSCCCCSECSAAAAAAAEEEKDVVGLELQGVRKVVDIGFWTVCVGVGVAFLLSNASSRSFRKNIFF